jgi:hypothetical protein
MTTRNFHLGLVILLIATIFVFFLEPTRTCASTDTILLYDEFDQPDLNTAIWTFGGNSSGISYSIVDGRIILYSGFTLGGGSWIITNHTFVPANYDTLTLEFRARWDVLGGGQFWDSVNGWAGISNRHSDYVLVASVLKSDYEPPAYYSEIHDIDETGWHTYRIELSGHQSFMYIDDILKADFSEGVPEEGPLFSRLGAGSIGVQKVMEIDYVKITGTVNSAPIVNAGGPYFGTEGSTLLLNESSASDFDGDSLTYSWSIDTPLCSYIDPNTLNPEISCKDNGSFNATLTVSDGIDESVSTAPINISNVPPIMGVITAPLDPISVSTVILVDADFTDPGILDTHEAIWDWGDGTSSIGNVVETNGSGTVTGNHSYTTPGVYTVGLTVTDKDSGVGTSVYQYIVVYDPNSGFVTGGGWLISPEGAYVADPTLTGKASFGFVSKYKKGTTVPEGNTEFQFKLADLNFHSDTYQWLVVAGAKAMFKGIGTINGEGEYLFLIYAIDGQITGGGGTDKFRIKIWWNSPDGTENVVYDNQLGVPDDTDPTTVIQGGSIVIHK